MRGRPLRLPLAAAGLMVLLAGATPARALDVRGFGIFKTQDYQQTDTNTPVLVTHFAPYSFSAVVQPNGLFSNQVSASVESPPPGFVDTLLPPPLHTDQPLAWYFGADSQAEVDANYPAGGYTLRIHTAHDGDRVLGLNLTTNRFPTNAPRVANHIQAQAIDSTQDFVLRWDPFAGGTTNDFIGFSMSDHTGAVVLRSASFGPEPGLVLLNGTNTSFRIPAGTLQAGRGYFAYLYFEKDVAINTDYAGARGVAGFSKGTSFTLASIGPPWLEPMGTTNSQFTLRLHGHETMSYIIQAVTVLPATQWTPIHTNVGTFNFTDPIGAGLGRRFYRAVQSPSGP